jgi:ubiquinone/menaquinone biosynthesis C-methylase UbiE
MEIKEKIKELYDIKYGKQSGNGLFSFTTDFTLDLVRIKNLHDDVSNVLKYYRYRKVKATLNLGKFKKGCKLLEVGSNMGQYSTLFAEKGFYVVGIDISNIIKVATMNANLLNINHVEYYQADVEDLSLFEDETFDGVISYSTLRYVPDLEKALKEIFRVTKKNGSAVLDFPNKYCPWYKFLKNKFGIANHINDHFYSKKYLTELYEKIGFRKVDSRMILFTHYSFNSNLLPLYKTIDIICENTPFINALAAIILCKGVK